MVRREGMVAEWVRVKGRESEQESDDVSLEKMQEGDSVECREKKKRQRMVLCRFSAMAVGFSTYVLLSPFPSLSGLPTLALYASSIEMGAR